MRYIKPIGFICLWMAAAALVNPDISADSARDKTLNYLNRKTLAFTQTVIVLSEQISHLDSTNPRTIISAKTALANCRVHYKKISFFLDYFYPQEGKLFNGPAKKELKNPGWNPKIRRGYSK